MRQLAYGIDRVLGRACALTRHVGTCFIYNKWVNTSLWYTYIGRHDFGEDE